MAGTDERDAPAQRHKPKFVRRLEERRETHKQDHGTIYRAAFVIAGIVLTFGGLAMLVLPGPAFVVIPIGLAILSLEFAWAARLLDKSLEQAQAAQAKAAQTGTRERVVVVIAVACAVAAFVVCAVLYDIPVLPV